MLCNAKINKSIKLKFNKIDKRKINKTTGQLVIHISLMSLRGRVPTTAAALPFWTARDNLCLRKDGALRSPVKLATYFTGQGKCRFAPCTQCFNGYGGEDEIP